MSRKQNRKHHQKKPKKNKEVGPEGAVATQGGPIDANKANGNEVHGEDNGDEEPPQLSRKWEWDLMSTLTAILAGGTIVTFALLWIQLQDARDNFASDQRPYVWQSGVEPIHYDISERITINISLADYGKTPALQLINKGTVFFGPRALDQAYEWFDGLANEKFRQERGKSVTVIPPGAVPEKAKTFTTIFSGRVVTADDLTYINTHDLSIVGVFRAQYEDMSGKTYHSDICLFRFQSGAIGNCEKHNQIY
jgi:hypothetical protein